MARSLTDDVWNPLRKAVPSFQEKWKESVSRSHYDPTIPYSNVDELVTYVLDLMQSDQHRAEQQEFFAALERSLSSGSDDVIEFLTIGVVEGFTNEAEGRQLDFRILHRQLAGPASRAAWLRALGYTHPEMTWSNERGLERVRALTPVVGRFRATRGAPLETRDGFLLEGILANGHVEGGHILRFRVTSGLHLRAPIAAVEPPKGDVSVTRLTLPHVNERSAAFYDGLFWRLDHEAIEFDIALADET